MNKKSIFTGFIGIIIFSLIFGYSLVFAGNGVVTKNLNNITNITFKLSDNIYLDSLLLKNNTILFKSSEDLSKYKIKSSCNIFSKLKYNNGEYYMFDLKIFNNDCNDENFSLINSNNEIVAKFKLNLFNEYLLFSKFLDLKTIDLTRFKMSLDKKISDYSKYSEFKPNENSDYYGFLKNNRVLNETIYIKNLIDNILKKRSEKYIVPISGYKMPVSLTKLPNSSRPYREDYTYGIHEGWDIDAKFGEEVRALDDGIIVRTVSDFVFSDLDNIVKGKNLDDVDLVKNLDILRGNQIWLKTMSGDIVMYSHLNEVNSNIKVGEIVRKGQAMGTVGKTGVPDKNYTDYHLHFEIHKNPFNLKSGESYNFDDYMRWDWLLKGESYNSILEKQGSYFE